MVTTGCTRTTGCPLAATTGGPSEIRTGWIRRCGIVFARKIIYIDIKIEPSNFYVKLYVQFCICIPKNNAKKQKKNRGYKFKSPASNCLISVPLHVPHFLFNRPPLGRARHLHPPQLLDRPAPPQARRPDRPLLGGGQDPGQGGGGLPVGAGGAVLDGPHREVPPPAGRRFGKAGEERSDVYFTNALVWKIFLKLELFPQKNTTS